ncbi:NYN domain-containing protein [Myxococcota bacterium]|nr:NYN domain-containing protein [Myxococcota bacterium]MBU1430157.1 NYN domain-containing protein [Myxococcota bacterium]MBU1899402.1 NYN domain-containing protein [Myxococcota bacterium]
MSDLLAQQRVAVLVDTANLYHAARARAAGRVDYHKLLPHLLRGRALSRAIAFVLRGEDVDMTPFIDALEGAGFEVWLKPLKRRADGCPRGDWSVGLTVAALSLAPKIDVMVLVTGDGAFLELLAPLKASGVRVEIAALEGAAARELVAQADAFYPIQGALLRAASR